MTKNLLTLQHTYCTGACTDNNGNVRTQTIGYSTQGTETALSLTQSYAYDSLSRLGSFTETAQGETYGYDRWGNRWVATTSSGLLQDPLTPSGSGWFSTADNRLNGVGYDTSGNQTQYNPFTAAYDAENRLQSVTSAVNGSAAYSYDGDGRRVKKTVGSTVTRFVYDAFGDLAAEYSDAASSDTGTQYLLTDSLGSVRAVADSTGTVLKRYDYRPFGQEIGGGLNGRSSKYLAPAYPGTGDGERLKFTGKERDAETGLDYFGARYFSGAQGRFASPDPLLNSGRPDHPQSWNRYSYVLNNPLK